MKKKANAHFWLNMVTALLAVLAVAAYIGGVAGFAYYDDLNPVIAGLGLGAAVAALANGILTLKKGENLLLSLLGIGIAGALAVCAMLLIEARVYSIGVLLFSELEKDNIEGYYALYCSLAAASAFMAGAACSVASNFFGARRNNS